MTGSYRTLALALAFVPAACAEMNQSAPVSLPAMPATLTEPEASPPKCDGQRTAKGYAQLKVTLRKSGGSFCIPEFRGFGGTMQYPSVERETRLVLRSSIKNLYYEPQLGSGNAIFYLNLHFLAGTHFGTSFGSGAGLTAKKIEVGQTYTAFGIVAVGHLDLMFPPCYTTATQGPYGGVLSNLGELFAGATVTGAGYGAIEIYSGQQVSQEC
jgi:hypothetical protein